MIWSSNLPKSAPNSAWIRG